MLNAKAAMRTKTNFFMMIMIWLMMNLLLCSLMLSRCKDTNKCISPLQNNQTTCERHFINKVYVKRGPRRARCSDAVLHQNRCVFPQKRPQAPEKGGQKSPRNSLFDRKWHPKSEKNTKTRKFFILTISAMQLFWKKYEKSACRFGKRLYFCTRFPRERGVR